MYWAPYLDARRSLLRLAALAIQGDKAVVLECSRYDVTAGFIANPVSCISPGLVRYTESEINLRPWVADLQHMALRPGVGPMAAAVVQITQAGDADVASGTPLSSKVCAQGGGEEKGKQQDTHDGRD